MTNHQETPIEQTAINRIAEMEILGTVNESDGLPVELETLVYDNYGQCFGFDVMTYERYERLKDEQTDIGSEPEAPRVYVVNTPRIALDALAVLIKSPPIEVFAPYLQAIDPVDTA